MGSETKDWRELVAQAEDLDTVVRAVAREHAIRHGMAETGESREIVADMLDAMNSMDQEAVLDLMEGNVTTLATGLRRYVQELEGRDELQPRDRIVIELNSLLAYPWPGAELDLADDGHVMTISVGGSVLLTVDREDNTLSSVSDAVEAVHKAVTRANG